MAAGPAPEGGDGRAVRRVRLLAAAAVALAGAAATLWPVPVLTVTAGPPERVVWRNALRAVVEIRLEYVHSVERTPVVEIYEAAPGGLRLVRMEFTAQGAGLPSGGYVREGKRFVLRTNRPLPALPVRVSGAGQQRLRIAGTVLDLLALAGEGGTVTVAVRAAPRLALLRGMLY